MATKERNHFAEDVWWNHTIIGYVPLGEDGKPYQPTVGRSYHSRKKPVTLYKTMDRAVSYSPVQSGAEVRMFQPLYARDENDR
jgi:hypothetical protein